MLTPDEPRPVQLMNTVWASRNRLHDDLDAVAGLAGWLGFEATERDLESFRTLRQALRDLAAVLVDDTRPIANDRDLGRALAAVNRAAQRAHEWPQLAYENGRFHRSRTSADNRSDQVLAATAAEAIDLFTGPDGVQLRACYAPGCVLYFVKDHPRREWCSPVCGNRVRAARHYRRNRAAE